MDEPQAITAGNWFAYGVVVGVLLVLVIWWGSR
jgi:hypothetical protein